MENGKFDESPKKDQDCMAGRVDLREEAGG
jgi:hypothetical protein